MRESQVKFIMALSFLVFLAFTVGVWSVLFFFVGLPLVLLTWSDLGATSEENRAGVGRYREGIGGEITSGAGFWIRALARLIDLGFGFLLGLIGGILGGVILAILQMAGGVSPGWEQRIQAASDADFVLSILGAFFYQSLTEGIHGASLGKLACQLRVVQQDGGPSNMKGAMIRNVGWFVDVLFFGLVGYSSMKKSPLNQRIGDVWARTIVLKSKDVPETSRRSPLYFAQALFLGASLSIGLTVIELVLMAL